MSDVIALDFGVRDGKRITLRELPLSEYGLKCDLTCPECHKPLEAVRKNADKPNVSWNYLRHHADETNTCPGYGENSCHMLSEHLFGQEVGNLLHLPAVSMRDGLPHTSRYTDTGRIREGWHSRPVDLERTNDDMPFCEDDMSVPFDLQVRPAKDVRIVKVQCEPHLDCGMIPDLLITVQDGDHTVDIAYEVRYMHPKSMTDVTRYWKAGIPVIECLVRDIGVHDMQAEDQLRKRLLGHDNHMEWLYHPDAHALTDKRYRMVWSVGPNENIARRQLADQPELADWKPYVQTDWPNTTAVSLRMGRWDKTVDIGIQSKPADGRDSLYYLPNLYRALTEVDDKGRPALTDEEFKEEAELDRKINPIDLTGSIVNTIECFSCHRPIVFWWLKTSRKYPKAARRVEERPQVLWKVRQVMKENGIKGRMCTFRTVPPKNPKWNPYRAFVCPYCGCTQSDKRLEILYLQWELKQQEEEQRKREEQYQRELEAKKKQHQLELRERKKQLRHTVATDMVNSYFRQLDDRMTGLERSSQEAFDWLEKNMQPRITDQSRLHLKAAADHFQRMLDEYRQATEALDHTVHDDTDAPDDVLTDAAEDSLRWGPRVYLAIGKPSQSLDHHGKEPK